MSFISKEKKQEVIKKLVNEQLKEHGVTYDDVLNDPNWFNNYTTTPEKEKEFEKWAVPYLMNNLNLNKKQAEEEFSWFLLSWGLKADRSHQTSSQVLDEAQSHLKKD
jgi:hypothetical protein